MALAMAISTTLLILYSYVMWILKKCSYAFPFSIIFIIEIIWGTISIVWIDHGVYISEQLRYSHYTGAALRYIVLIAPFAIITPWMTDRLIKKDMRNPRKVMTFKFANHSNQRFFKKIFELSGVICIVYMFVDILIAGSPLFHSNITKGNFYPTYSVLPLTKIIHDYVFPVLTLYCGLCWSKKSTKSKITNKYLVVFFSIIYYQILLKNKFYGLYDYLVWFFIPVLLINVEKLARRKRIPVKYIAIGLLCISSLLFICYNQYSSATYVQGKTAIQYLLDRILSLQCHTFWGVDYNVQQGTAGFDLNVLIWEILGGFSGVSIVDPDFGIAKIMYSVTASTYADDMISTGFLFAGNFATVSLSYSGYIITFLFSIVLGFIVAHISYALYKYILNFDPIGLFFTFWVYRRFYEFYRVGTLSIVLSWKMVIIYLFVAGLMINARYTINGLQIYKPLERNSLK